VSRSRKLRTEADEALAAARAKSGSRGGGACCGCLGGSGGKKGRHGSTASMEGLEVVDMNRLTSGGHTGQSALVDGKADQPVSSMGPEVSVKPVPAINTQISGDVPLHHQPVANGTAKAAAPPTFAPPTFAPPAFAPPKSAPPKSAPPASAPPTSAPDVVPTNPAFAPICADTQISKFAVASDLQLLSNGSVPAPRNSGYGRQ
jgi:hypothetical protein